MLSFARHILPTTFIEQIPGPDYLDNRTRKAEKDIWTNPATIPDLKFEMKMIIISKKKHHTYL